MVDDLPVYAFDIRYTADHTPGTRPSLPKQQTLIAQPNTERNLSNHSYAEIATRRRTPACTDLTDLQRWEETESSQTCTYCAWTAPH